MYIHDLDGDCNTNWLFDFHWDGRQTDGDEEKAKPSIRKVKYYHR